MLSTLKRQRGLLNVINTGQSASPDTLFVIGSANIDSSVLVDKIPEPGETVIASQPRLGLGGKGANQAVAAKAAGASVSFVARLGNDAEAGWIRRQLDEQEIATDNISTDGYSNSGTAYIAVDPQGENAILVSPGSNMKFSPEAAIDVMRTIAHNAALVLAQAEIPTETIDAVALEACKSDVRFVLNLAPFARMSQSTLNIADPLIVNTVEAEATLDYLYGGARHRIDDINTASEYAGLLAQSARSVIVTLGAGGCMVGQDGRTWHLPADKVDSVVDTTGAGDAFVGAVAAKLITADDLTAAARYGNMVSAKVIGQRGATYIVADDSSTRPVAHGLIGTSP